VGIRLGLGLRDWIHIHGVHAAEGLPERRLVRGYRNHGVANLFAVFPSCG
jgi:hypothetical protein